MHERTRGALIPHRDFLIAACLEGLEWTEMQNRLAVRGVRVTSAAICVHCNRRGYSALHPYSVHFDESISRRFRAGEIEESDLLQTTKNKLP